MGKVDHQGHVDHGNVETREHKVCSVIYKFLLSASSMLYTGAIATVMG